MTRASDTARLLGAGGTLANDVTISEGSPSIKLNDTDTSRFIDILYGTRNATFRNTMASGEDMDTVAPEIIFSTKDDGETREHFRMNKSEAVFNEGSVDLDFRVEGNNSANLLFVDGGNDHICMNTSTDAGGVLNIKTTDNTANLVLFCTDADDSGGPILDLFRNSSSPADGDVLGLIRFKGEDAGGNETTYAQIVGFIQDEAGGAEDGTFKIETLIGGSSQSRVDMTSTETVFNEGLQNIDFRVEGSGNANLFFVDANNTFCASGTSNTSQVSGNGVKFGLSNGNGRHFVVGSDTSSGEAYSLYASGAYRFYVAYSGGIFSTSTSITGISDERLKENIVDLETGLTEIMALKPRRFDWKNGDGKNIAGFVAQEVETVLPDLIGDFKHDELDDAKALKMGDVIPTLVKAIQEQQATIEALTARIVTLENA